jgi:hypothetical protein
MKTPRDILFARHQAAVPKLDAIRRAAVAELNNKDAKAQSRAVHFMSLCLCCSDKIWQELVWPCRRVWTGLAAAWVLIFIVNLSQRDSLQVHLARSTSSAGMTMTFRDQQKLLNELFADRCPLPAEAVRPRIFSPKPRTETMNQEIA